MTDVRTSATVVETLIDNSVSARVSATVVESLIANDVLSRVSSAIVEVLWSDISLGPTMLSGEWVMS